MHEHTGMKAGRKVEKAEVEKKEGRKQTRKKGNTHN